MTCDTHPAAALERVRVARCGCGTFHLTLGPVTLRLDAPELVMLARAIHRMAARHPEVHADLVSALCQDLQCQQSASPATGVSHAN